MFTGFLTHIFFKREPWFQDCKIALSLTYKHNRGYKILFMLFFFFFAKSLNFYGKIKENLFFWQLKFGFLFSFYFTKKQILRKRNWMSFMRNKVIQRQQQNSTHIQTIISFSLLTKTTKNKKKKNKNVFKRVFKGDNILPEKINKKFWLF